MRVLMIGAGGVGIRRRPHRRAARLLRAVRGGRLRRGPRRAAVATGGRRAVRRRPGRRLVRRRPSPRWCREHAATHVLNAVDPRFVMPIFDGRPRRRRRLPRHGDEPVHAAPGAAVRGDRRQARRRAVRRGRASGRSAGRLALVGIGVEPGLSDVFARYAADHLFSRDRRARASATAPTSSSTATTSPRRSPSGRRSRSASTRRSIWEADRGWFTTAAVQRARDLRLPRGHRPGGVRQRRARGGAAHAALGRGQAGHLQVRPRRRSSSTSCRPCTSSAWTAPTRSRCVGGRAGAVSPRDVVAACLPDPATLGDRMTRQDLRRAVGHRPGQGRRAARGLPLPRGRQRVVDGGVRQRSAWSGRPPSTRSSRSSCSPTGTWSGAGVLGPEAFDAAAVPGPPRAARTVLGAAGADAGGEGRMRGVGG